MITVVIVLVIFSLGLSATAGSIGILRSPTNPPNDNGPGTVTASRRLPTPTQSPPPAPVRRAHAALHAVHHACQVPLVERNPERIRKPLHMLERFAVDYPNAGFTMDGEQASTLALLIVVWNELESCDPSFAGQVARMIPPQYRGN